MGVDLLEGWMPTVDEVSEVIDGGGLVLDEDQDQMQCQSSQSLLVTRCID